MTKQSNNVRLIDERIKSWFWLFNSLIDCDWDVYKKMIYAVLSCYADGSNSKVIDARCAEIAERAGCSIRKARSVIGELAKGKVIEIQPCGNVNMYRLTQEDSELSRGNWLWCDKALFERDDLDIYEKLVYLVLIRHADGRNTRAVVSYSVLAKGASCSRRKVISVIASLVEKGLISEPIPTPKGNIYLINNVVDTAEKEQNQDQNNVQKQQDNNNNNEVVQVVPKARDALVHEVPEDPACGALPDTLVVHGVPEDPAPHAPIQERNTICMEEQKQALKCLLDYGISESVAYRYSDLGLDLIKSAIAQTEEKKLRGQINKSTHHYLVWLLREIKRGADFAKPTKLATKLVEKVQKAQKQKWLESEKVSCVDHKFFLGIIRESLG